MNWWVPGELLPMNIPELDGTKVVFFDTKRMKARKWDASFFQSLHEALSPEVRIERELTPEEVNTWIQKVLAVIPRQQGSENKPKEEPRGWKGFLNKIFRK